jgi:ligand-binding sensor domain-containing protein
MVLPASDGNLWVASPTGESVYSITTGGVLLQTVSFSSQPNADAHPNLLAQDNSSGILFGTTGEPNPAYNDFGSVFSINAGLPPQ